MEIGESHGKVTKVGSVEGSSSTNSIVPTKIKESRVDEERTI